MSTGVTQQYYCQQCGHTVTPTAPPTTSLLICPHCTSTFIEQFPNPNSAENSAGFTAPSDDSTHLHPEHFPGSDQNRQFVLPDIENSSAGAGEGTGDGVNEFRSRVEFQEDGVHMLQSVSANFQSIMNEIANIVVDLRRSVGESSAGPRLRELIRVLSEIHPNRNGSPPAARAVVEALPGVGISEEMIGSGVTDCVICMESFCVGVLSKELPCKHVYHGECILPWLDIRNSCPVCRFELPTDDLEYENRRMDRSGTGGLRETLESSRGFRTQLALQVRASAEGSNRGDGNSGGGNGNAGGSNEDLD